MINQAGGFPQFPSNILQSGLQQAGQPQQGAQNQPARDNKIQQNRGAETSTSQNTNKQSGTDYKALAESIIAKRNASNTADLQPAAQRGSVVDIVV